MRALRTAQPRRACDTTVFSCANRGDGVPGQWGRRSSHGRSGGCVAVSLSISLSHRAVCGQLTVVPAERSSLRRVSARSWASSIAHRLAQRSRVRTARTNRRSAPSRHFPAPLRRSRVRNPSPGRPVCTRRARPPESLGRSPVGCRAVHGGPRRFVPLRSGACARRSGD